MRVVAVWLSIQGDGQGRGDPHAILDDPRVTHLSDPDVDIGRRSRLSRVVVDRAVRIPDGLVVGEDPALDARRFRRTDMGICLITQSMIDALE